MFIAKNDKNFYQQISFNVTSQGNIIETEVNTTIQLYLSSKKRMISLTRSRHRFSLFNKGQFRAPDSTQLNSTGNLSEIEQSPAELLTILRVFARHLTP